MWSSLTSVFKKDLGEFAAVVTTDTKRLLGDADGDTIITGDESTDLAAATTLDVDDVISFQRNPETFLVPLSESELADADTKLTNRFSGFANLIDPLMENSVIVAAMYDKLVTQTEGVASAEFFKRYFIRLQLKRLRAFEEANARAAAAAITAAAAAAAETSAIGGSAVNRAAGGSGHKRRAMSGDVKDDEDDDFEAWDDVGADALSTPVTGAASSTTAAASSLSVSAGTGALAPPQAGDAAHDATCGGGSGRERVDDLERLIAALSAQVERLREENETLKKANRHLVSKVEHLEVALSASKGQPTVESPSSPSTPPTLSNAADATPQHGKSAGNGAPGATPDSANRRTTAADDDDDWGTLV